MDQPTARHAQLAKMLDEHVARAAADERRWSVRRPLRRLSSSDPTPGVVRLDPLTLDAITLAIDESIQALLPGLIEDAIARVLPDVLDEAVTEIVEELSPPPAHMAPPRRALIDLSDRPARSWTA